MRCPKCDESLRSAEEAIEEMTFAYVPCLTCSKDAPLAKDRPLMEMGLDLLSPEAGKCPECGKRHMDIVMAQSLGIMIRRGLKKPDAALKDAGTPMIEYGVPLFEPPRLGPKSIILIADGIDKEAAAEIITTVPEIKGVLNRKDRDIVGIPDTRSVPKTYEVMAGCDVRADIVSSLLGELVLYRTQSDTHIEFWRTGSVKIKTLEKVYLEGGMDNKVVLDGMASIGTLGLIAALGGARKVILNDAWLPAIRSILLNLEANKGLLGVETRMMADVDSLPEVAGDPVLIAKSTGLVDIEVYHSDLLKLDKAVPYCDLCIIDTFPGVDPAPFVKKWNMLAADNVITL